MHLVVNGISGSGKRERGGTIECPGVIFPCNKETVILTSKNNSGDRRIQRKSGDGREGEENFVGDSEIIALGGASNETKDRPLG